MGAFDDLIPERKSSVNAFEDLIPPAKNKSHFLGGMGAISSGSNRMVLAGLPGLPVDTALNVLDLAKAGAGTLYGKATGNAPPEFFDPTNRAAFPMSSAWIERQISKTPVGEAIISSDAAQYPKLHAAGQAIGSTIGSKAPVSAGTIAALSTLGATTVGETTGNQEAAILAQLLTPQMLAQSGNIRRLNPIKLFDPAARQASVALRPYSPEQIKKGIELQAASQGEGNPISASQALGGGGRVADLENYALDSQYAPKHLLRHAQSQPERAASHAQRIAGQFGKADYSLSRANKIEAAAEAGLQMPKELARKLAQPFYNELERTRPQLSESARWKIAGDLEQLNSKLGLIEDSFAGKAVSDVAKTATVESPILRPDKGNHPFRRSEGGIYDLDNYLKEVSSRIEKLGNLNADAKQSVERAGLRPALNSIKTELLAESPTLRAAKEVYHKVRTSLEDTVRTTGLADIAKRPDADMIKKPSANWNTLTNLLKRQQSPADLERANTILSRSDPDAVATLTKNVIEQTRLKHFGDIHTSAAAPYQFAKEIRQIPNLNKAIEITARRSGAIDPIASAKGFDTALKVLEASGLPRGMPSGGSTAAKTAGTSPEKSMTAIGFGHELAKRSAILRSIQQAVNRHEIQQLTKTLDRPDSLNALRELADLDPTSARAKQIVMNVLRAPDNARSLTLRGLLPLTSEPEQRGLIPSN